jgi:hypothetical protein
LKKLRENRDQVESHRGKFYRTRGFTLDLNP